MNKDNEVLETVTVLLIFLMAVITQIFLISLTTILLKRIKLIIRSSPKKYYYFVIFYIVSKMILCVILEVKIITGLPDNATIQSQDIQIIFKNTLIFADCAIIELFLISFQHYLGMSFAVLGNQKIQNTIKILMQGVQILTFICVMIPLVIFNIGIVNYDFLNDFVMILNCMSVLSFLVAFFFMNFRMTGLLMEKKSSELIKKVYKLLLMILLSRVIMAGIQILVSIQISNGNFQDFITIIQQNEGKYVTLGLCFILYMLIILITQGLPLMMSLRQSVIIAFSKKKEFKRNSIISQDESFLQDSLLNNVEEIEPQKRNPNEGIIEKIQNIQEIEGLQKMDGIDDYSIFKGKYYQIQLFIRELGNISNYIIEETVKQIDEINKLVLKSLNPIKLIMSEKAIYLIEQYIHLNLDLKMLELKFKEDKLDVAIKIAEAIKQLHQSKYSHGSLHPKNIMFNKNGQVLITGYGLQSLRKYLSLTADYSNLNIYTAVQLLNQRQKIVVKPTKEADIYSFGILLYQIITDIKSYRELSIWEVRKKFKQENFRPKIPQNTDERIKKILRMCWQENPKDRPEIGEVVTMLKNMSQITL